LLIFFQQKELIRNVREQGLIPNLPQIEILEAAIPFLPEPAKTFAQTIVNITLNLNETLVQFEQGFNVNVKMRVFFLIFSGFCIKCCVFVSRSICELCERSETIGS
jgi:hypothetical protein